MVQEASPSWVYVGRDAAGTIVSVSLRKDDAHPERCVRNDPGLAKFVQLIDGMAEPLARSDADMSRVLEDLVDLLIQKEVMCFTDLPLAAQAKLMRRREMRDTLTSGLLSDDESLI